MKIIFTNTINYEVEPPEPSFKYVPEWYKKIESYRNGSRVPSENFNSTATIKKCMPVFDAIAAGYIITSPADIYVSLEDIVLPNGKTKSVQRYAWSNADLITFHPIEQALNHPMQNGLDYPKFMNPWAIKTPKGYSTLFVQPFHRESVFTIMPGIVDTDKYFGTINFPFVMNDTSFVGFIPKGTPLAQVIPFKRESWVKKIGDINFKNMAINHLQQVRSTFHDFYKNNFYSKKNYK
jgi:hypothetical protein